MSIEDIAPGEGVKAWLTVDESTINEPVAYGVLVLVKGNHKNPFTEINKQTMKHAIAKAVYDEMITGESAEVMTMTIKEHKPCKKK